MDSYTPQPFILNCNFWKIYKYVPNIANILYHTFFEAKNGKKSYKKIKDFIGSIDLSDQQQLEHKERIHYYTELCSSTSAIDQLKVSFHTILSKKDFEDYNLRAEADNLLFLCLHLYDSVWDHTGNDFNNDGAKQLFTVMEYDEYPKNFRDATKAKELAAFLQIYVKSKDDNKSKPKLVLRINKSEGAISDYNMYNLSTEAVINSLIAPQSLETILDTYGEMGSQLIFDLNEYKQNPSQQSIKKLQDHIAYVLSYENKSPYPARYRAISYFCLCLREYLVGAKLIGTSNELLHKDQLKLFAEILHLFGMEYGSLDYTSSEYTTNLGKTIRDYFKKNSVKA